LTVYLVQHSLLDQLVAEGYGKEGDTVLFDIQADQRKEVIELVRSQGLPVVDEAPIVTMRLNSIKGQTVESLLADRRNGIPRWALRREYRSTFTDRLRSGEKLIAGQWHTSFTNSAEAIPVSLEEGIARDLRVGLGDELSFDVQGVPVKAKVASLREVDWRRVQPNFFVVFPPGSLEGAPSFSALVTRSVTAEKSAGLQRAVVQKFPNISVIDLRLILQTVEALLGKVSIVVQFMALFTAFTGVLVLAGAVLTGRYQRVRESVLLRTLGASQKQIFSILIVEYLALGFGAALTGAMLAWAAAWGFSAFHFQDRLYSRPVGNGDRLCRRAGPHCDYRLIDEPRRGAPSADGSAAKRSAIGRLDSGSWWKKGPNRNRSPGRPGQRARIEKPKRPSVGC
jgi:putative ABC transport system permease protein